jgi:prepilin peptidase CpaA
MSATWAVASQSVLIVTAAVLFYVALTDLRHYKIRNEFVLVLAGLFFVHAFCSGRWVIAYWNVGFAAACFLVMLYFYATKLMGGGDLKLLTVAFLWTGPFCLLPFAIFLSVFAGIHALAVKFHLVDAKLAGKSQLIAFAPSIAGALIGVFIIGCLRPA